MSKTYYEILGVNSKATDLEIREAYRNLVKQHHPDRFTSPEEKKGAEDMIKEITEAFTTLSHQNSRRVYDESLLSGAEEKKKDPSEVAKHLYLLGMRKLTENDLYGAMQLFDSALQHNPDHSDALFQSGVIRCKNPKWRAKGVVNIERAIELAPFDVNYVREYAQILFENGVLIKAQRMIEKALSLDSEDAKTKSLYDKIFASAKKGGGFKIFGGKT